MPAWEEQEKVGQLDAYKEGAGVGKDKNGDSLMSTQPCGCDPGCRKFNNGFHICSDYPNCAYGKSEHYRLAQQSPYSDKSIEKHDAKLSGIEDSGLRQRYSSGALRDPSTGKLDWTRITYGPMMRRWADHLTRAEAKYPDFSPGVPNFSLISTEEELFRYKKSAFRHFMDWYFDKTNEDHAAATFFNINGVEIIKAKMRGEATDNIPAPSVHVATIPAASKGSSTLAYEEGE